MNIIYYTFKLNLKKNFQNYNSKTHLEILQKKFVYHNFIIVGILNK